MEKYIGVKIVHAEAITRGNYNKFKGWAIPENENPNDDGYLVKYNNDYISWCPKVEFEKANRRIDNMTIGLAMEAVGKGFRVCRKGWNGKGMHVTMSKLYTPDNLQIDNTCLLLFNVNRKYNTWIPSITDLLAEDWMIVD